MPVLNIPAADIKLRPEYLALLPYANVEPEILITLDDLPPSESLESKLRPENTRWILVDHNALQGALGSTYANRVCGVIDHHEDEHKVPKNTGDEPRIIEKCGSCTSLVTTYCMESWDKISSQGSPSGAALVQDDASYIDNNTVFSALWDCQAAKLALASVLIDTNNLQNQAKVTKHDVDAAKYLEAKIMASTQGSKGFNRDQLFQEISDAKQDIGRLKLHDILRKDYKQWLEGSQAIGVSSVVKNIDFLVNKAVQEGFGTEKSKAFLQATRSFAKNRKLGIFAIMTTSTSANGDFQRELFLLATNAESVQAASKFAANSTTELGLADWHGSANGIHHAEDGCWWKLWQQHNVQHSRKRVAPLLRGAMSR
jgi:exopolyphosphatase